MGHNCKTSQVRIRVSPTTALSHITYGAAWAQEQADDQDGKPSSASREVRKEQ